MEEAIDLSTQFKNGLQLIITAFEEILELYDEDLQNLKRKNKKRKGTGQYRICKNGKDKCGYQIYGLVDPDGYFLMSSSDVKKLNLFMLLLNYKLNFLS